MASTTRRARRTWRHSWRKRRSRLTLRPSYWTTTARATGTSAPPCTSAARRRTAPSLSRSWRRWEKSIKNICSLRSWRVDFISFNFITAYFKLVWHQFVERWGYQAEQCHLCGYHLGAPKTDVLKFYKLYKGITWKKKSGQIWCTG